ncbi:MAG: cation:proton antiporter subunit C [Syntrophales bacterium]|jgi:multicomponent Na+:H+ antiporter subunit C|nr:cation:proton antiporter subunit C [Syntrophales bacterium]MCK9528139.1 cation:proton antiporter subunit C [Syntrophales bacterium]MDX9921109.1 cation:proton antiporter subunit C [Syntrophales bacterium]
MEFLLGHYSYFFVFVLLCIGLYAVLFMRNLVKQIIGLNIFQGAIILFWVSCAVKWNATVPIYDPDIGLGSTALYINPLPHTLMLTAIVVGVATTGVAYALLIIIYKHYKTVDEEKLIEEMKRW